MNIISDFSKDVRSNAHIPGGYEWWYFDGMSSDGRFSFVIIFYEGNPFSTRYNGAQLAGKKPSPVDFPAVSISVYEQDKPIYYSFTEFSKSDCEFDEDIPRLNVGRHSVRINEDEGLEYILRLSEQLPNGDHLDGEITFSSDKSTGFLEEAGANNAGHLWNLVQPRAEIDVRLTLGIKGESRELNFSGLGYHDHNTGQEPMRSEFDDWYWGRFHFDSVTLVYYVMNRKEKQQHQAWLFEPSNCKVLHKCEQVDITDKGFTLFGLNTAHKLGFRSSTVDVRVQQSQLLDNGPFYQRYHSEAFLKFSDSGSIETTKGITEYIYPSRIYSRLFWPFVNMRIWYKSEGPHWVQRSQKLYRWTW